jgi:hypothetical protein
MITADSHSKDYRDLGLPGVTVGPEENRALPLIHIDPVVVSKVLYCGMSVQGKWVELSIKGWE